ncbi:MAG: DUF4139 domain-containing protein [Candidatus Kapaibacterium sp.]|jgi:hypothetical protein
MKKRSLPSIGLALTSALLLLAPLARAQDVDATTEKHESLSLTVYNNNLGVVRDVRSFDIKSGTSEVQLKDVPALIDPTTVKITSIKHPKAVQVVEQNYEYDLVSQTKLLEKYIDHRISVTDNKGAKLEGTLLAIESGKLTLLTGTSITMLPDLSRYTIDVPSLPAGLITRPTLIWQLQSDQAFSHEPLEVLYQTGGISWHAEYIAALSDDDRSLDLTGWVSLDNRSGGSFVDAKLKLVAGALHRVATRITSSSNGIMSTREAVRLAAPQFEESGLFEYHLYDLQRKTSIKNNEVKQISLLEANGVAAEKRYTYRGAKNVEVTVMFVNNEKNHLGVPIPMGIVRVMKRDKDGTLEFVGEDRVEHTPRDEKITLKVGDAFDLLGERVVTDSRNLGPQTNQESIEITLKNRKDEDVVIDVVEELPGSWEITKNSTDFEKKNANQIVFHIPVKARADAKVSYTVVHHW